MNIDEIVQQLKQERSRLDDAIQALQGTAGHGKRRGSAGPGRTMSAAARKRISEMMKKRWAERKKAKK